MMMIQNIEVGRNLSSRRTETSFKKGRFSLRLEDDGNLQLHSLNAETASESDIYSQYYESNTNDPNNPGIQLVFNQSGEIYVLQRNNSRFVVKDRDPDFSIAAPFYISTGFLLSTIIPKEARRIVGGCLLGLCRIICVAPMMHLGIWLVGIIIYVV